MHSPTPILCDFVQTVLLQDVKTLSSMAPIEPLLCDAVQIVLLQDVKTLSSMAPMEPLLFDALQIVLLLDVDFLPPEELSRIFSARQEYQSTLLHLYNNAVIVLPAFEPLQGGSAGQALAMKLAKGVPSVLSVSCLASVASQQLLCKCNW